MKTLSKLLVVAGLFAFVACGPSAKDQAEKAKQDSIKQADSLMAVKAKEDSTAKVVAEKAKAAGVEKVAFDRAGFAYHGRVKALADAAREAGLQF